jgi:choline dehydrogenase-like flavoprotein
MEFAMTEELKTNYCIVGWGITGVILASKWPPFGKKIVVLEQRLRFAEGDRHSMLLRSKETLNDYADYNDEARVLIYWYDRISQKPSKGGYHGRDNEGETEWDRY